MRKQPLAPWALGGVDCPRCGNRGCLVRVDEDGVVWARECGCMPLRRAMRTQNQREALIKSRFIRWKDMESITILAG